MNLKELSKRVPLLQCVCIIVCFILMIAFSYNIGEDRERQLLNNQLRISYSNVELRLLAELNTVESAMQTLANIASSSFRLEQNTTILLERLANFAFVDSNEQIVDESSILCIYLYDVDTVFNVVTQAVCSSNDSRDHWWSTAQSLDSTAVVIAPIIDVNDSYLMTFVTNVVYNDRVVGVIILSTTFVEFSELVDFVHYIDKAWFISGENNKTIYVPSTLQSDVLDELVQQVRSRQQTVSQVYITSNDGRRLVEVRPDFTDQNLILGVSIPVEEYSKTVSSFMTRLILVGAILAALLIVFTVHLHKKSIAAENKAYYNEQKNNFKNAFLANMSHEIRTPMNAILGISEVQLRKDLSGDLTEAFDTIYNAGAVLMEIIDDILDISKIDADKVEIKDVEYSVPSLVQDTVRLIQTRFESTQLKFTVNVEPDTISCLKGDVVRVRQILVNILSNSFKYTKRGEVEFFISSSMVDNDTCSLKFVIKDTGLGMTKEQLKTVWDEYTRFNTDVHRNVTGTGLGMSITKKLIHLLRGTIAIQSEYKVGTVVEVEIPQTIVNNEETCKNFDVTRRIKQTRQQKTNFSRTKMPNARVLVVDDVKSNVYVAKNLLAEYDINVDSAYSGQEAISKISEGKTYDVIFMDYMMPEMDGLEAAKVLRSMGYAKPIVALTANVMLSNTQKFADARFNDFITKPISAVELDAVLHNYCDKTESYNDIKRVRNSKEIVAEDIFVEDVKDATKTLLTLLDKDLFLNNGDLNLFITTVHGVRNVLRNIDENQLAGAAHELESLGDAVEVATIAQKLPEFIEKLIATTEKHSQNALRKPFNKKILIVDDVQINLTHAASITKDLGCIVDFASTEEAAVKLCESTTYDVILLDSIMPPSNCDDIAKRIRAVSSNYANSNIYLLKTSKQADVDYLRAGCDGIVNKPLNRNDVINLLKDC